MKRWPDNSKSKKIKLSNNNRLNNNLNHQKINKFLPHKATTFKFDSYNELKYNLAEINIKSFLGIILVKGNLICPPNNKNWNI